VVTEPAAILNVSVWDYVDNNEYDDTMFWAINRAIGNIVSVILERKMDSSRQPMPGSWRNHSQQNILDR
jgi:hypothetical protein